MVTVSNPGPASDNNNFAPSYGQHTVTPLAVAVQRALKRETDDAVIRRWAKGDSKFNLAALKPFKFDKPTTTRGVAAELGRQAKRMAAGAGSESITAAGVRRDPELERFQYEAWMAGTHGAFND